MAAGRWFSLSLSEQLGNVGSEVGRAAAALRRGNEERKERALERAFELMDLTLEDARWRGRCREIARAREVCADTFYGERRYHDTPEGLERYFYQFALSARREYLKKRDPGKIEDNSI